MTARSDQSSIVTTVKSRGDSQWQVMIYQVRQGSRDNEIEMIKQLH